MVSRFTVREDGRQNQRVFLTKKLHQLDFWIRQRLPSYRFGYRERSKHGELAERTFRRVQSDLWALKQVQSQIHWVEKINSQTIRWQDWGCGSFLSSIVLAQFFLEYQGDDKKISLELEGIEADGGRLYRNLFRRKNAARYYARLAQHRLGGASTVSVRFKNCLSLERPAKPLDVISFFYPFLHPQQSRDWGLLDEHYEPYRLYEAMALRTNFMFLAHQGADELALSKQIFDALRQNGFKFECDFVDFDQLPDRSQVSSHHFIWAKVTERPSCLHL